MKNDDTFSFNGRVRSIHHALNGISLMLRSQHNAWAHAVATLFVVLLGIFFQISRDEWCWIIVAVVTVWTAEAMNTAFELLCDVASPDFHPIVKNAKDVAAGAVLFSAIGAICLGIIVFSSYIFEYT